MYAATVRPDRDDPMEAEGSLIGTSEVLVASYHQGEPPALAELPKDGGLRPRSLLLASLLPRALTCISLSLLTFSLPGGPLALPAGGEPGSRFLRGGLQMCRLLEQLGLSYPG